MAVQARCSPDAQGRSEEELGAELTRALERCLLAGPDGSGACAAARRPRWDAAPLCPDALSFFWHHRA